MVQVLGPGGRRQRFSEALGAGLGAGLGSGISQGAQMAQQHALQSQEQRRINQAYQQLGIPEGTPPELAKTFLSEVMREKRGLTPLQQSQMALNLQRLQQSQEQSQLFNKLKGGSLEKAEQGQSQGPGSFEPGQLEQLAAFAGQPGQQGVIGNMAKAELEKEKESEKIKRREFTEERSYHAGFSKEMEKKASEMRESLPRLNMSLDFARNAVETGDVEYFSPNKLADATGIDLFRNAKGAQLVTAGKENLLSNMARTSAKAQNIWFEQRLNSMFAKIGQSNEANLTTLEMLEGEAAMQQSYLKAFDRLAKEDEDKYGFVRKDIDKRARDSIKNEEKEIMRRSSYRMKEIEEQEKGRGSLKKEVGKNVIKGTPLTLNMAKLYLDKFGDNALSVAEKNGYYIPTAEEFRIYQSRPEEFREAIGQ